MTEQEIILLCKKNDPRGQKELVYQHSQMLMGLAFRYTKSMDDSKDLVQDTFIHVFKNIKKYDVAKGNFLPWMKTVAVNIILMHLRKNRNLKLNKEGYQNYNDAQSSYKLINTNLEEQELFELILKLPDLNRLVFNLYAIEGYSHKEIARKLNIKESYSRTILTRARVQLKELYYSKNNIKLVYDG